MKWRAGAGRTGGEEAEPGGAEVRGGGRSRGKEQGVGEKARRSSRAELVGEARRNSGEVR